MTGFVKYPRGGSLGLWLLLSNWGYSLEFECLSHRGWHVRLEVDWTNLQKLRFSKYLLSPTSFFLYPVLRMLHKLWLWLHKFSKILHLILDQRRIAVSSVPGPAKWSSTKVAHIYSSRSVCPARTHVLRARTPVRGSKSFRENMEIVAALLPRDSDSETPDG